jgi:hypothetical protein
MLLKLVTLFKSKGDVEDKTDAYTFIPRLPRFYVFEKPNVEHLPASATIRTLKMMQFEKSVHMSISRTNISRSFTEVSLQAVSDRLMRSSVTEVSERLWQKCHDKRCETN